MEITCIKMLFYCVIFVHFHMQKMKGFLKSNRAYTFPPFLRSLSTALTTMSVPEKAVFDQPIITDTKVSPFSVEGDAFQSN